jgi:DNA-binding transcriptional regulator LsrR (DeoR family)
MPEKDAAAKADRALTLHEQGLTRAQLAERLGLKPQNINGMLQRAKHRRDKAEENGETKAREDCVLERP